MPHSFFMADLTEYDKATITALLRDTIAADHFALLPRLLNGRPLRRPCSLRKAAEYQAAAIGQGSRMRNKRLSLTQGLATTRPHRC
jgi:hypothetical protein